MADTIPVDCQVKTCIDCGLLQSVTAFRYRRRGQPQRQGRCRSCYNRRMRAYRRSRREKTVARFASAVLQAKSDGALRGLVNATVAQFGGIDKLGRLSYESTMRALLRPRTLPAAVKVLGAVCRLIAEVELCDAKPPGPDYAPRDSPEVQDPDPLGLNTASMKEIEEAIAEYRARRGSAQAPA